MSNKLRLCKWNLEEFYRKLESHLLYWITFYIRKESEEKITTYFNYSDILADPNVKKPIAPVMFLKPTTSYITEGEDIVVS